MKIEKHIKYVNKTTMLWEIEPYKSEGIPLNAIFHKGRCGIGGTTMEILHDRHSIIVVPTTPSIIGKQRDHPFILAVMGDEKTNYETKVQRVIEKLKSGESKIKIMTTPDSFECIIDAANRINRLEWLYEEFFLLLDECHSFVTEAFRKKITIPFRFLWFFKSKCLISATPIKFSDPRFAVLEEHEIRITEKLGTIELIESSDINGVIHFILSNPDKFDANVHIFYNSVGQLSDRVRKAFQELGALDCNIYCSKSDENFKKLGSVVGLFKDEPIDGECKKFNIYTSKYFEAFDLRDPKATIILITDVNAKHTKVGITNKGFQAIGRLRSKPNRIIHFTNHSDLEYKRDLKYFKRKHTIYARDIINGYNRHIDRCKTAKLTPFKKFKEACEDYAEVSKDGFSVNYEIIKVDQAANHEAFNEEYNNMDFIEQAWQSCNYNVVRKRIRPFTLPSGGRMLVEDQLKEALNRIQYLEENKGNMLFETDYIDGVNETRGLNTHFELAYKAYHNLGLDKIYEVGLNAKLLKEELYRVFEASAISAIEERLIEISKHERHYSNNEMKLLLQTLYKESGFNMRNGSIKNATAKQIENYQVNWSKTKSGYHLAPTRINKSMNE
ncbi:DEAD/DEAH box helicase family protein [Pedobacter agri]|uniref:DEAD/DEAH box helicase family protein n=1 Tax=Pedobacter agri TaxID=454586 RepID=UPI00293167E0|nr:DEAD/DEAH box helicase family protein [Pedobacter agri]